MVDGRRIPRSAGITCRFWQAQGSLPSPAMYVQHPSLALEDASTPKAPKNSACASYTQLLHSCPATTRGPARSGARFALLTAAARAYELKRKPLKYPRGRCRSWWCLPSAAEPGLVSDHLHGSGLVSDGWSPALLRARCSVRKRLGGSPWCSAAAATSQWLLLRL